MAQAAVVLRDKRRRKVKDDLEEGLSIVIEAPGRKNSYSSALHLTPTPTPHEASPSTFSSSSSGSIHFGGNNANIVSGLSRKDCKTPRPEDERRKKVDKHNEDGVYRSGNSANVILYVGLGMIAIGLVITFVGLGDKGFQTLELKLIGPSLVGCGIFFALLRILFCTVPSCFKSCYDCCCPKRKKEFEKNKLLDKKLSVTTENDGGLEESIKSERGFLPPITDHLPLRSPLSEKNEPPRQRRSAGSRVFERVTSPGEDRKAKEVKDKSSMDEFSVTESDLILQEEGRRRTPSASSSLKQLTSELVLTAEGL